MRTDEDVTESEFLARPTLWRWRRAAPDSDYRATNLAILRGNGMARRRGHGARCRHKGREPQRRLPGYRRRGRFPRTRPCTAGSVSLRHDLRARTRHTKFARGYKAGGFNIGSQGLPADKRSFVAESLQNLELGMRASNEDASLAGDIAFFYMRRYDQQVPAGEQLEPGNPLSFVLYTDNAASGENYGLGGDAGVAPERPHYCSTCVRRCSRPGISATFSTIATSTVANRRTRRSTSTTWASNTPTRVAWYARVGFCRTRRFLFRRVARRTRAGANADPSQDRLRRRTVARGSLGTKPVRQVLFAAPASS